MLRLTTHFQGKLDQVINQYFVHILSLVTDNPSLISGRRRMTVQIIIGSISTKVWDRTLIELATPGFAARHKSATRYVTDCALWPSHFAKYLEWDVFVHGSNSVRDAFPRWQDRRP